MYSLEIQYLDVDNVVLNTNSGDEIQIFDTLELANKAFDSCIENEDLTFPSHFYTRKVALYLRYYDNLMDSFRDSKVIRHFKYTKKYV